MSRKKWLVAGLLFLLGLVTLLWFHVQSEVRQIAEQKLNDVYGTSVRIEYIRPISFNSWRVGYKEPQPSRYSHPDAVVTGIFSGNLRCMVAGYKGPSVE